MENFIFYVLVQLTEWSSERQADNSDFIGPSIYGDLIYIGDLTISVFWIYFWCIILNSSGHVLQTKDYFFCHSLTKKSCWYPYSVLRYPSQKNKLKKPSITIILPSDCFKKNKMTKLSKCLTKCPILGSFLPKSNEIPTKIRLSFFRCKTKVASLNLFNWLTETARDKKTILTP